MKISLRQLIIATVISVGTSHWAMGQSLDERFKTLRSSRDHPNVPYPEIPDELKVITKTSKFRPVSGDEANIARYGWMVNAGIGFGTAWIYSRNNEEIVFCTARHVAESYLVGIDDLHRVAEEAGMFKNGIPMPGLENFGKSWISNALGVSVSFEKANIRLGDLDRDIAFIVVPVSNLKCAWSNDMSLSALDRELTTFVPLSRSQLEPFEIIGRRCTMVGFPRRGSNLTGTSVMNGAQLINDGPYVSYLISVGYDGEHSEAAPKFYLFNNSSEPGFSGSPVILENSGQIIGMMIMCVPVNEEKTIFQSLAVDIREIEREYLHLFGRDHRE